MAVMPVERGSVWMKLVLARHQQRLAVHRVIVSPVLEFLAYAWANFKNVAGRYRDVAMIEQAMNVSPQQ